MGKHNRGGDDRFVGTEAAQAGNEGAVDLDAVDDEALEVVERRVAGAEVVDDDARP